MALDLAITLAGTSGFPTGNFAVGAKKHGQACTYESTMGERQYARSGAWCNTATTTMCLPATTRQCEQLDNLHNTTEHAPLRGNGSGMEHVASDVTLQYAPHCRLSTKGHTTVPCGDSRFGDTVTSMVAADPSGTVSVLETMLTAVLAVAVHVCSVTIARMAHIAATETILAMLGSTWLVSCPIRSGSCARVVFASSCDMRRSRQKIRSLSLSAYHHRDMFDDTKKNLRLLVWLGASHGRCLDRHSQSS